MLDNGRKSMKRTFALILAALAAAALFGGLVHAVLVAAHVSEPAATTVYGLTPRSGAKSSGRQPLADGTKPIPGGWNRILLEVSDINGEAARLRAAGVKFGREDIVSGPGGSQIWVVDPSGNLVELFQYK